MNSRTGKNEKHVVNSSYDLLPKNQSRKGSVLSFPFDHIYACSPENLEPKRHVLQNEREVDISHHCEIGDERDDLANSRFEIARLNERLIASESETMRLKNLLKVNLDMVQQQSDQILQKEKSSLALRSEIHALKSKLECIDKIENRGNQQKSQNPPPLIHLPLTAKTVKIAGKPVKQITLNSFAELLVRDNGTINSSFVFESDLNKAKVYNPQNSYATKEAKELSTYLQPSLNVNSVYHGDIGRQNYTVETNRVYLEEPLKTENRARSTCTMTGPSKPAPRKTQNNGSGVSQAYGKTKSSASTTSVALSDNVFGDVQTLQRNITASKKPKMIHTYEKSSGSNTLVRSHFIGSLSDRLQLIDTTPTGEDPYQMGEADFREQSPIPKLMLQKNNVGKMKIYSGKPFTVTTEASGGFYEASATQVAAGNNNIKVSNSNLVAPYVYPGDNIKKGKTMRSNDSTINNARIKTGNHSSWPNYSNKDGPVEASVCDFSYGENAHKLASNILPKYGSNKFQKMFSTASSTCPPDLNQQMGFLPITDVKPVLKKSIKKLRSRASSLYVADSTKPVGSNQEMGFYTATVAKPTIKKSSPRRLRSRASSLYVTESMNSVMPNQDTGLCPTANIKKAVVRKGSKNPRARDSSLYLADTMNPDICNQEMGFRPMNEVKPVLKKNNKGLRARASSLYVTEPIKPDGSNQEMGFCPMNEVKPVLKKNHKGLRARASSLYVTEPVKPDGSNQEMGFRPMDEVKPVIKKTVKRLRARASSLYITDPTKPDIPNQEIGLSPMAELKKAIIKRTNKKLIGRAFSLSVAEPIKPNILNQEIGLSPIAQWKKAVIKRTNKNLRGRASSLYMGEPIKPEMLNQETEFPYTTQVPKTIIKKKKLRARASSLYLAEGAVSQRCLPISIRKRARSTCPPEILKGNKSPESNQIDSLVNEDTKAFRIKKRRTTTGAKVAPAATMTVDGPYPTNVGEPDYFWYLGRCPNVDPDDIAQLYKLDMERALEVPNWRDKLYSSSYSLEGTENLDDEVFNKRHQKQEADERRRMRWDVRRLREQKNVERLRRRQSDVWCSNDSSASHEDSSHTFWPEPYQDISFIEITDNLPVAAFGMPIPDLPKRKFRLPWVVKSKFLPPLPEYSMSGTSLKQPR